MKTRVEQAKTSGISLIEILAVVVVLLILSASFRMVSNGNRGAKSHPAPVNTTNSIARDLHARANAIHTYDSTN